MSFEGVSEVVPAGVNDLSKEKAEHFLASAPKLFERVDGAKGSARSGVGEDREDPRDAESSPARRMTKPHRGKDK